MSVSTQKTNKILVRQKSSPALERPVKVLTLHLRSKTPPPQSVCNSRTATETIPRKSTFPAKNIPSSCVIPRNRPSKITKSTEEITGNVSKPNTKCTSEVLIKEDLLDIKYNAYLQSCLMIAHNKDIRKRNEGKILKELEELQRKLLIMDEKMTILEMDFEKFKLFKQIKENLSKKIEDYKNFLNTIDINRTAEYIRILEKDLNLIQLKHFSIPRTEKDATEILQILKDIANELKLLPVVEKKILPLTQLHSSLIKTKQNIEEEEKLKISCERKLKTAEELLYHECFLKSQIYENFEATL